MPTNAEFWSRFEERVAPFNLLQHPFYQAWSKGELTREDLRSMRLSTGIRFRRFRLI